MTIVELPVRPGTPAADAARAGHAARRPRPWAALKARAEVAAAVAVTGAGYLTGASLLVHRYHSVEGDALARVHNGALVMFSRDPHLAAVGFVWNPLPSLLTTPFLLLKHWFPSLLSLGFAGSIVAAACGAAAAGVLLLLLRDWGAPPLLRWALLAAVAAHPLVLYSGSNGMSEAPYLLFLLLTCRYVARWLESESTADLVLAGASLALGYLTRYEVVIAGGGVALLVAGVRFARSPGGWRERAREAAVDTAIVVAPLAFTFAAWALVSWVIVGSPFEQFTSAYGNSAQLDAISRLEVPRAGLAALGYATRQLLLLELALPVAAVLPLVVALRRRAQAVLAPLAVFGTILAFEVLAYVRGGTAGWLRYYAVAVPLVVLAAATMASPSGGAGGRRPLLAVAAAAMALAGVVSGTAIVHDHALAREEATLLEAVVDRRHASPGSRLALERLRTERAVVAYLDSLHPRTGSVLIDLFQGFKVTTQSTHPRTFVVTSDRDFQEALADPVTFRVRYIVVPDPVQGSLDAVNRAYPTLYRDGAGIATLLREFVNAGDWPTWRVYRVDRPE